MINESIQIDSWSDFIFGSDFKYKLISYVSLEDFVEKFEGEIVLMKISSGDLFSKTIKAIANNSAKKIENLILSNCANQNLEREELFKRVGSTFDISDFVYEKEKLKTNKIMVGDYESKKHWGENFWLKKK